MGSFGKNEDCPPSADLLAFQEGEMHLSEGVQIRNHLLICEFCAAEVEFYSHYPPAEDIEIEEVHIPEPLRELAEAILNPAQREPNLLDDLIKKQKA